MSYTQTSAFLGDGSTLGYGATSNGSFTTYGEITKITLPKKSAAKIKATNMQSPGATHEYLPGFIEPGEYEFDANFVPADWKKINSDVRKKQYFQIVIVEDGGTDAVIGVAPGFIQEVGGEVPVENIVSAKVKICLTGAVTWT